MSATLGALAVPDLVSSKRTGDAPWLLRMLANGWSPADTATSPLPDS
jgi:hypothetical protein